MARILEELANNHIECRYFEAALDFIEERREFEDTKDNEHLPSFAFDRLKYYLLEEGVLDFGGRMVNWDRYRALRDAYMQEVLGEKA